jgi:inosine-uridine nucleoside N-ribohydrolase
LSRTLVTAEYVHGKTGLDGYELPDPVMPLQEQAGVDFIIETVMRAPPKTVTLCALGPLTNLGLALQAEPQLGERLQEIVLMGGGLFEGGNTTPAAEFNIYVDPEAADMVMHCGAPVTMIPLDLTHQTLTSDAIIEAFRSMPNETGAASAGLLDFFERFDVEKYGSQGGPLHDPNVIAFLLQARALRRTGDQRGNRNQLCANPRHDGRRLVGRHGPSEERQLSASRRRGGLLVPAAGTPCDTALITDKKRGAEPDGAAPLFVTVKVG